MQIVSDRTSNGTIEPNWQSVDRQLRRAEREIALHPGMALNRGNGVWNIPGGMEKPQMIRPNLPKAPELETIGQNVGHVFEDLVALAESCSGNFSEVMPAKSGSESRPVAVFMLGMLLLAGTVPVCLLAIAEGLVVAGVPRAAAYAVVIVASLVVAAGMVLWAWQRFRRMPSAFARSREELVQNIHWIERAVMERARWPERPGRDVNNAG